MLCNLLYELIYSKNEEVFKANIEKLGFEVDKLKDELTPDQLDKYSKVAAITSALVASLAYFSPR